MKRDDQLEWPGDPAPRRGASRFLKGRLADKGVRPGEWGRLVYGAPLVAPGTLISDALQQITTTLRDLAPTEVTLYTVTIREVTATITEFTPTGLK